VKELDLVPLFDSFVARAQLLEEQGVPFPVTAIRGAFAKAMAARNRPRALQVLEHAERLYHGTYLHWVPVRDLLSRAEVLRTTAEELGIESAGLPSDTGNPRALIQAGPLSGELFQKAAEMASASIATLRKAVLRQVKVEAGKLGTSIQAARRRGENVEEVTASFRELLQAVKTGPSPVLVQRIAECRRLVGEIPVPPPVGFPEIEDADEILLEARILARRIHRIKRNARDAQSAARLMSHVRAALSEDRRAASPQDEIEELWGEVTRLSKERQDNDPKGAMAPAIPPPLRPNRNLPSPYALPSVLAPDESEDTLPAENRTRRRAPTRP
jgi:hypothetical protein